MASGLQNSSTSREQLNETATFDGVGPGLQQRKVGGSLEKGQVVKLKQKSSVTSIDNNQVKQLLMQAANRSSWDQLSKEHETTRCVSAAKGTHEALKRVLSASSSSDSLDID